MKRGWKIFIIVLLCILIVSGWIVYSNWNTILGVVDGLRYSQEDVEQRQEENKKELQKFLDENENVTVRDLTDEEIEALAKGEIGQEDAVQIITGQKTLDEVKTDKLNAEENGNTENDVPKTEPENLQEQTGNDTESPHNTSENKPGVSKPGETKTESGKQPATGSQTTTGKAPAANSQSPSDDKQPSGSKQPSGNKQPATNNQQTSKLMPDVTPPKDAAPVSTEGKTSDQIVSELIATLYVQKSVYLSTLDSLEAEIGAEFEKLPAKEKPIQKPKIIAKYMPIIAEWEKNCDSVVYGILDQIEAELKKSGKDTSIVTKIDDAYKNEKRLKKAYYINNYMS